MCFLYILLTLSLFNTSFFIHLSLFSPAAYYNTFFTITCAPFPDVPKAPGRPEIIDYDNKSVDLKWTVPESDGGAPIIKYIVQKKDR